MTNKPMLSVERDSIALEALKVARQFIANGIELGYIRMPEPETPDSAHGTLPMIDRAIVELRALLDESVDVPEPYGWVQTAGQCINQITQDWDVVEGWTAKGYLWEALYIEYPVAQHQGEPVAWIVTDMNGDSYFAYDRQTPSDKPLYAEQPAPLAVVMPEILHQTIRDTLRNYRMSTLDDGHGGGYPLIDAMTADGQPVSGGIEECQYLADAILNACIEEVSRLNGVKP